MTRITWRAPSDSEACTWSYFEFPVSLGVRMSGKNVWRDCLSHFSLLIFYKMCPRAIPPLLFYCHSQVSLYHGRWCFVNTLTDRIPFPRPKTPSLYLHIWQDSSLVLDLHVLCRKRNGKCIVDLPSQLQEVNGFLQSVSTAFTKCRSAQCAGERLSFSRRNSITFYHQSLSYYHYFY